MGKLSLDDVNKKAAGLVKKLKADETLSFLIVEVTKKKEYAVFAKRGGECKSPDKISETQLKLYVDNPDFDWKRQAYGIGDFRIEDGKLVLDITRIKNSLQSVHFTNDAMTSLASTIGGMSYRTRKDIVVRVKEVGTIAKDDPRKSKLEGMLERRTAKSEDLTADELFQEVATLYVPVRSQLKRLLDEIKGDEQLEPIHSDVADKVKEMVAPLTEAVNAKDIGKLVSATRTLREELGDDKGAVLADIVPSLGELARQLVERHDAWVQRTQQSD